MAPRRQEHAVGLIAMFILVVGCGSDADDNVLDDTAPPTLAGRIVFTSDRDGNSDIHVMHASGADQRNLTRTSSRDRMAAWSPDGSRIAFA